MLEHGVEAEFAAQRQWLDAFWDRSDVVVHGQPAVQQAIRWNLFQVAQATARAEQSGVPAKGVTGSGYGGHYFWDTEIYVLPFLTYTSPQMARSALRFRYNMLGAARSRAPDLAQSGALFPWRTVNGEEASAYYAAGTAQYHIDADIAYALWKYVGASGDQEFMNREGVDIMVETARMWADLGFWRETNAGGRTFHIHGVTGPGRVHHGGQRQPVHQRDGPVQPGQGRRVDAAVGARPAGGVPAGGQAARRDAGGDRGVDGVRRGHGHPVRRAPASTRRTRTSWTGRSGT